MAYDEMGNYTGYDESYSLPVNPYDFEEEDRKKEELKRQLEAQAKKESELASQVSHKQELTTYGDGSRTVKTTQEIPAGKIQPVNPSDYNARIAQQESGNRPDIGYHDINKGTAAGMYGMTDAGYEDARKLNPNLPADRLQSSPEQQTAAMNAYTQQNAKYLQNYGVEPTENNLAAAHFLGAKGLSDYLKSGYISDAAAKANGGADNVRRIVNQRLGGQAAPASGAAQQPAPQMGPVSPEQAQAPAQPAQPAQPEKQPNSFDAFGTPIYSEQQAKLDKHVDAYTTNQNDPTALMQLSTAEDTPDWMKDRARNRAADIITQKREMEKAQEKVSTMSESELAKAMREKTTGGSWVKAIFYAAIGAKNLAQAEGAKLGLGTDKIVTGTDGKSYMVKVSANGTPIEGYSAETGVKLKPEELINAVGGAGQGKWQTSAEFFQDKNGNVYQSQHNDKGQIRTVNTKTGAVYSGDEKLERLRDASAIAAAEKAQGFKRENYATATMEALKRKHGENALNALNEFKSQSATPVSNDDAMAFIQQYTGTNIPAAVAQGAGGQAPAVAPAKAPMAPIAPEGQVQAAPVAPVGVAQTQPTTNTQANPAVAPTVPTKPGYDANGVPVRLPTEGGTVYENRVKQYEEEQKKQRDLEKESSLAVIKHRNEVIVPAAMAASDGSQIVKNQLKVVENPRTDVLFGLYNQADAGSKADKNWAIVRDVISGKLESKEGQTVSEDWARTNLKGPAYSDWMAITSGNQRLATAEIKSGGFGAQISNADRASAEQMQIDIGRAPALGFYNQKAQQLYNFDSKRAKQAWAADKQFKSADQLETAWSKESSRLTQQYQDVADERNAFIKANSDDKSIPPGLVREAYKRYPVPTFDPNLNNGQGGWNNPVRQRKLVNMLKG